MKDEVFIESPYIQDTPIIRGEDAKRFLQRMMENHKETPEERDRREADYEMIMKNSEGYL
ncbi:MAG: hypothetical protein E7067_03310 [Lentimicrobiaceae bacterium]|nr:hypothetical protein [Lentimicrobiaceae bacterium]